MLKEVKEGLINIFGERVAFHKIERALYSSDLASLPNLIRNQIKPVPDAVVQPASSEEIIALLNLTKKYGIPLTPRGAGTSGYGGAIVALVGANGAGKTTLLKTISGIMRAKRGEILFSGKSLIKIRPQEVVDIGISHVPEGRRLFSKLTYWRI